jgi:hypothetical protein
MKRLDLTFTTSTVKQGDIVSANYHVSDMEDQNVSGLEGRNIKDTIYIHKFSENEVKLVFLKVPEGHTLSDTDLTVNWNSIAIEGTEASQQLIFGKFEIPSRSHLVVYSSVAAVVLLFGVLLWMRISRRLSERREREDRLKALRSSLLGALDYETVVELWKNKQDYFEAFEHVKVPFLKLEAVLNKYQFKSSRTQAEIVEIMQAYREFKNEIEGGFRGI